MATHSSLGPGQALYVLERLIADRRLSLAIIRRYLAEMAAEIRSLEERLANLRAAHGGQPKASTRGTREPRVKRSSRNHPSRAAKPGRKKHVPAWRRLQGSYIGYLRQLPTSKRPQYQRIAKKEGRETAIKRMREALGK